MNPTTEAGKAHAEAWIDAVEIEWGLGEGDRETMLGEVAAIEVEAVAVALSALRDALDGLVEAAERVLAYGRVRPFADAARDQLRAALAAAKEAGAGGDGVDGRR